MLFYHMAPAAHPDMAAPQSLPMPNFVPARPFMLCTPPSHLPPYHHHFQQHGGVPLASGAISAAQDLSGLHLHPSSSPPSVASWASPHHAMLHRFHNFPAASASAAVPPRDTSHFMHHVPSPRLVGSSTPRSGMTSMPAAAEATRLMMLETAAKARARKVGPSGQNWIKGRMTAPEKQAVDDFVSGVLAGELRVHKGDLARDLREFVNPRRPPEFFEKLVSRRNLNSVLAAVLAPKISRKAKREATAGVTALSLAVEVLEARMAPKPALPQLSSLNSS